MTCIFRAFRTYRKMRAFSEWRDYQTSKKQRAFPAARHERIGNARTLISRKL